MKFYRMFTVIAATTPMKTGSQDSGLFCVEMCLKPCSPLQNTMWYGVKRTD